MAAEADHRDDGHQGDGQQGQQCGLIAYGLVVGGVQGDVAGPPELDTLVLRPRENVDNAVVAGLGVEVLQAVARGGVQADLVQRIAAGRTHFEDDRPVAAVPADQGVRVDRLLFHRGAVQQQFLLVLRHILAQFGDLEKVTLRLHEFHVGQAGDFPQEGDLVLQRLGEPGNLAHGLQVERAIGGPGHPVQDIGDLIGAEVVLVAYISVIAGVGGVEKGVKAVVGANRGGAHYRTGQQRRYQCEHDQSMAIHPQAQLAKPAVDCAQFVGIVSGVHAVISGCGGGIGRAGCPGGASIQESGASSAPPARRGRAAICAQVALEWRVFCELP